MTMAHATGYKCGPGFGSRGELAYNLRKSDLTWNEIAERLSPPSETREAAESAMTNLAKKHAKAHGLPWPLHISKPTPAPKSAEPTATERIRCQQKLSYVTRAAGKPWGVAASTAGYKYPAHAVTGAKKHAVRMGLPWPIPGVAQ